MSSIDAKPEGYWYPSAKRQRYLSLPAPAWAFIAIASAGLGFLSPNPWSTALAVGTLPVCARLTWRNGEPPVLFFAVAVQWLQAAMPVFHADLLGISLSELGQSWSMEQAVVLSLAAILVLACGMRVAMVGLGGGWTAGIAAEASRFSIRKVWIAYLFVFFISALRDKYLWIVPGLSQPLLALMEVKWVLFYLLALIIMIRRERWVLFFVAVVLELLLGFSGFFSDFKQVFFVLGLVYLTTSHQVNSRTLIQLSGIVAAVLFLAVMWASVKDDYREYVSGNSGQQIMAVSRVDALDKVTKLFSALDWNGIKDGTERLVDRIGYVNYFSEAIDNVPSKIPYESGALWKRAVLHVLVPRLLWPEKPALVSDTLITEKYTGRNIIIQAGRDTSVPMGYIAESYIDFGVPIMFLPILALGLLWGTMYRFFVTHCVSRIFGFGIAVAILTKGSQIEASAAKLLGGLLMAFIVLALVLHFIVPRVTRILGRQDEG